MVPFGKNKCYAQQQERGTQVPPFSLSLGVSHYFSIFVYLFPSVAMTNYRKCGGLNNTHLLSHRPKVQDASQFSSVQSLSSVRLFATPWIAARQASLSITSSWSSLKLTSIESMMPSSHLILCHPLLLLPPIPPSIRVLSNESILLMRWPEYWSSALASFFPKNTQDWSPLEWTGWISLQSKGLSRVFSNTAVQMHQFFSTQPSSQSNFHIHTWPQEKP